MAQGTGMPVPFPGERGLFATQAHAQIRHAQRKDKRKRKIAKESRKKNRKKK